MVSLRIVSLEYYVCFPVPDLDITYSEFRNLEVRQVPVIQVFGSTESGMYYLRCIFYLHIFVLYHSPVWYAFVLV